MEGLRGSESQPRPGSGSRNAQTLAHPPTLPRRYFFSLTYTRTHILSHTFFFSHISCAFREDLCETLNSFLLFLYFSAKDGPPASHVHKSAIPACSDTDKSSPSDI